MQQSLFATLAQSGSEPKATVNSFEIPITDAVFTVIDVETTVLSAKKN